MYQISGLIICIILLGYGIGLLNFLNDYKEDNCEMTYMFEYPQYVRISNNIDKQFPKYGLYAYSEGRVTSKARSMYFDGIPVLFIPGNAGSHKQVRSLSSVALRKALSLRTSYHFDYYTIDLNNEFSGLYGPLLYDQLQYVNNSLYRIFELYAERKNKPRSIVIIGHSMGGVIAKNLLSQISDTSLISTVITLAAPLKRAPVVFDYHMHNFYKWDKPKYSTTTFVSLSAGYTDFLIHPYLSDIKEKNSLFAVTTNIPRSWIESDHVQIIWCKQTILALSRAMFDSVDVKTRQISLNATYRQMVFEHHLVRNSGTSVRNRNKYAEVTTIDYKGQWIESLLRQYSVEFLNGLREPHWYMVGLSRLYPHEMLTVLAINLEVVDWVFACNANFPRGSSRVCFEGIHLSHFSEIAPSAKYKRRYFQINMHKLMNDNSELTHVVFRALPTDEPVIFHVDVYNSAERRITVDFPKWWLSKKTIILKETVEKALHYDLVLPQLEYINQFYQLFVTPLNCATKYHHASATLTVPWSNQNHHAYFTNNQKDPLSVRLYGSKPLSAVGQDAVIRLTLDPSCTYQISIKPSIPGMLGQMARLYTPLLLTNVAAVILMTLKCQLRSLRNGYCSGFFVSVKEGAKPYYVLTIAKLLSKLFSGEKWISFFPKPDILYLVEDRTDFLFLPLLLYLCSVGIVWVFAIIFSISLITLESTVNRLALKFLAKTVSFTINWSDHLMSMLHKVPFIVAGTLIFLCLSTCGSLALCVGAVFYFLKLTQMSQDYMEEVVWFIVKKFAWRCKQALSRNKIKPQEKSQEKKVNDPKNSDTKTSKLKKPKNKEKSSEDIKETILHGDRIEENSSESNEVDKSKNKDNEVLIVSKQIDNTSVVKVHSKQGDVENEHQRDDKDQNEEEIDRTRTIAETSEQVNGECPDEQTEENRNTKEKAKKENELSTSYNSIFFHSTLFFIWCIITVINIPAVLTWAHNFKFSKTLTPDDSFIPGLALSLCALPLWQFEFPKIDRKWFDKLEVFVMIVAVLSLMFSTISLFRLNYLLTLTIVVITLHQLFAPKKDDVIEHLDDSNTDKDADVKYKDVKAKLD